MLELNFDLHVCNNIIRVQCSPQARVKVYW